MLAMTPGPAVLFVLSSALRAGTRASVASTLGILSANALYFALSATGVGALLIAAQPAFVAVKWIGAAYLIFLGLRLWIGKANVIPDGEKTPAAGTWRRLYSDAVILQLSNPKAIIYFTALVPQFIDPRRAVAPQMMILGATSILPEFFVLLTYGAGAGRASLAVRQSKYVSWINRAGGTLLICAGAGLAALHRT